MSATPPYETFQFDAIRVTKVTATGAPSLGANKGYFTKSVVKGAASLVKGEGQRSTLRRGDGRVCATSKTETDILAALVKLELCALDAGLISLLTGNLLLTSGGTSMGFEQLGPSDAADNGVILECWTKAWDTSRQAQPTVLTPNLAWFHWVFPWYKPYLEEIVFDNAHNSIPLAGESESNPHTTINGPYDDWPSYVTANGGITRPYGVWLDDDLPVTAEGFLTVSALAS